MVERTDIALGMFNSSSSGYVMTAGEIARIAEIPAICAIKDAAETGGRGIAVAAMAPGKLVYWDVFAGTASYLTCHVAGVSSPLRSRQHGVRRRLTSATRTGSISFLRGKLEEAREQ